MGLVAGKGQEQPGANIAGALKVQAHRDSRALTGRHGALQLGKCLLRLFMHPCTPCAHADEAEYVVSQTNRSVKMGMGDDSGS